VALAGADSNADVASVASAASPAPSAASPSKGGGVPGTKPPPLSSRSPPILPKPKPSVAGTSDGVISATSLSAVVVSSIVVVVVVVSAGVDASSLPPNKAEAVGVSTGLSSANNDLVAFAASLARPASFAP
jgi:hypothetical protein